jgi:hypothetical protein
MTLVDWDTYLGPFGVLVLGGRDKATGERFTATVRAIQGGPLTWHCWTDRGPVTMMGSPQRFHLGGTATFL